MSSPFGFFRKRQKALLAIATVFIVFVFVVGSALSPSDKGDDERGDQVAARWNGGEASVREMAMLVRNRVTASNFARAIASEGIKAGGLPEDIDLPIALQNWLFAASEAADQSRRTELESLALWTAALSDAAEESGMKVSDAVINQVLRKLGGGKVDPNNFAGILAGVAGKGDRSEVTRAFSTLRRMLQAYYYQSAFGDASQTILPSQRWDAWKRVNERISVQAAVLPVASFVTEVGQPSDDQVEQLYEEFKEREPNGQVRVANRSMPSPAPGFAKPQQVVLTYLHGNVTELTEKLLADVTEQEITDFYEANKDFMFVREPSEDESDSDGEESAGEESAGEESAGEEGAEGEDASDSDGDTGDAADAEQPAGDDEEVGDDEAGEQADAPAEAADAAADAAVEEAADAAEEATQTPAAGDGAAVRSRRSPFRLTAYQAEATPESDDAGDEAVDSDDEAAEPGDEADAEASESEAETEAASDAESMDAAEADEAPTEYEPLDVVIDEVRRQVARQKAIEQVRSEMRNVHEQLRTRYSAYRRTVAEAAEKKEEAPAPPAELTDLSSLGEKYGYEVQTTAEVTQRQLFDETIVGKAFDADRQDEYVAQAAFSHLEIGEPYFATEPMQDCFVVVKTMDEERSVPPLDEVRDQVVAAWRQREAAKLAEKKADDLATALQDADRSFADYMADLGYQAVPPTDMFAWLDVGTAPSRAGNQLRISEVPGLDYVGPDFMEKAFGLKEGEITAVMNVDRSAAYVVRLHSRERTQQELREAFLATAWNPQSLLAGMVQGLQQVSSRVAQQGLSEALGFELDEEWVKMRREQLEQRQ